MALPKITLSAGTSPKEGANGTFLITLDTPAPAGGLTVNYNLTGTATLNADYTVLIGTNVDAGNLTALGSGSFTIAEGQTSATLNVTALQDAVLDPNETVKLNLAAGTGYQLVSNLDFSPKVDYASIATGTSGFGLEDLNGDGKLDLAVVNRSISTVSVFLRNSTNTGFDTKTDYAIAYETVKVSPPNRL
jgi:hypothetical protein